MKMFRQELPQDDKEQAKRAAVKRMKMYRQKLPQDDKELIKRADSDRKRLFRDKLSQDDKELTETAAVKRMKMFRQEFTQDDKEQAKRAAVKRMKIQKRLFRDKLPQDDKELIKRADSDRKRLFRDKLSQDDKELTKTAAVKRMKMFRQELPQDDKEQAKRAAVKRMKMFRQELPQESRKIQKYKGGKTCQTKNEKFKFKDMLEKCKTGSQSRDNIEYICKTCMKHIQNNKMPAQAEANNMMLPDVPKIIQDLTPLEACILSTHTSDWENLSASEDKELWNAITKDDNNITNNDDSNNHKDDTEDEESEESDDGDEPDTSEQKNVLYDTCIQRTDPHLDTENIITLAPGEGKSPVNIMLDEGCEELSFPQLFPTGQLGFDRHRKVHLTPKKYINARILNKTGVFAKNIEYLFLPNM
ncbi:unnamed protein product [Mytilus edulis]|uniref:Uncharacterized protein n=1 Tax=Mytilus edulis TaxID=6550 RepID=A0A8S3R2W7_MYTED|nr:unnamed protein product [Mytilus edulis]